LEYTRLHLANRLRPGHLPSVGQDHHRIFGEERHEALDIARPDAGKIMFSYLA
jgi:hypothetical protein